MGPGISNLRTIPKCYFGKQRVDNLNEKVEVFFFELMIEIHTYTLHKFCISGGSNPRPLGVWIKGRG